MATPHLPQARSSSLFSPMTFADYKAHLAGIRFGKRLPTALYIHTGILPLMPHDIRQLVENSSSALSLSLAIADLKTASQSSTPVPTESDSGHHLYNLLKFHTGAFKISFLRYPAFWDDPHPALAEAVTLDLVSGIARSQNFAPRANPPILHRKETFISPTHFRYSEFASLTKAEELAGLFKDPHTIGFRDNWQNLLKKYGLSYDGHQLITNRPQEQPLASSEIAPSHPSRNITIDRHLTALVRHDFSKPVKMILESGLLMQGQSFFDYGCGHGGDVRGLTNMGYTAHGWDPAHAPDETKTPADVVNLGFVLNVIENPAERVEALAMAWQLTRSTLIVSTLVAGREGSYVHEQFGDGLLTSRNTFQKYFEQTELQSLIEQALETEAIPLGLGIFAIFRDDSSKEDFLARRTRRHFDWATLSQKLGFSPPFRLRKDVYAENRDLLDDFWRIMLELGRPPKNDEYPRLEEVRKACQSIPRAARLFVEHFGSETLEEARRRRRDDLLVYLALASFERKLTPFCGLSQSLQRSITTFFGDYATARKEAYYLLRGAGSPEDLEMAVDDLDFGWRDEAEGHFTIHRDLLDELPPVLRIYIGCGARLYGDPSEADLIKVHLHSKKLTLTYFDDFLGKPFPELTLRVKIDFRRLFVSVFESPPGPKRTLLFFKERFLAKDYPDKDKMVAMSKRLRKLGATEANVGHGVEKGDWENFLLRKGLNTNLSHSKNKP